MRERDAALDQAIREVAACPGWTEDGRNADVAATDDGCVGGHLSGLSHRGLWAWLADGLNLSPASDSDTI